MDKQRTVEQQPWTNLSVHAATSAESKQTWKSLFLKDTSTNMDVDGDANQTAFEYLETISTYNPITAAISQTTPMSAAPRSATTPLSAISAHSFFPDPLLAQKNTSFYESLRLGLPLEDRVRNLLVSSHAVSFTQLLTLFTSSTIDPQGPKTPAVITQLLPLVQALGEVSHCIDGVFYVHSSLLYKGHARHARNVLLGLLMEKGKVGRLDWANSTRMNTTQSGNMLKEVCVFDEFEKVWVSKVEPDLGFEKW